MNTRQLILIAMFLLCIGFPRTVRCEVTSVPPVTVKVVVHWISNEAYTVEGVWSRVTDQIAILNNAFAGANVQFELSDHNRIGDYHGVYTILTNVASFTDDVSMLHTYSGGHDLDSVHEYLNLYVCNYQNANNNAMGYGFIREDRYYAGSVSDPEDNLDAVVVNMRCFAGGNEPGHLLGKLAVHEIGHWLGLDDMVGTNCDVNHNYMNIVDDQCMTAPFTDGQITLMRNFINLMRPWLNCIKISINSDVANSTIDVHCDDLPQTPVDHVLTGSLVYWPIGHINSNNQKVGVSRRLEAVLVSGTTFDRACDNWTGTFISGSDQSNPLWTTPTTGGTSGNYTAHYHTQYNIKLTLAQNIDGGSAGNYTVTDNGTPINGGTYSGIFIQDYSPAMRLEYNHSTNGIFQSWSDGNQNADYTNFIPTQHTTLHAVEKSHLLSIGQDAFAGSFQRKMVTDGSTVYMVYKDNGYIFFLKNSGSVWTNETMLSSAVRGPKASEPSIARLSNGSLHVVWDEVEANNVYHHVYYSYSTDGGNNWYPSFKLADNNIYTMYGSTSPVISGTTIPVVVWSRSGAYNAPTGAGFEVLGDPANNVATAASYLTNTSYAASPSLDCQGTTGRIVYAYGGVISLVSFALDEIGWLNYQNPTPYTVSSGYGDCGDPSLVRDGTKLNVAFSAGYGQYICFRQYNGTSWQTIKQFTHSDPVNGAHICMQPSIGIESNGTNSNLTLVWQCYDQMENPLHISKVVYPIGANDWNAIVDLGSGNNPAISGYSTVSNHPWIGWSGSTYPSPVNLFQDAAPLAPPTTLSSPDNPVGLNVTLTWSASYNAETYTVHFTPPTGVTIPDITNIGGTTTTVTLPANGYGTYQWQVKGVNYIGSSAYSTQRTFTAWALSQPVLTFPANGALLQGNSVTLMWNAVSGATAYHVQIRPWNINTGYGDDLFNSDVTGTSLSLTGLTWNSYYEWNVYAKNSSGNSQSVQRSLTTPAQPPHMLSSSSTAISTNSQRKLVRGSNGNLYLTYENGGNIFYTVSTDYGVTWSTEVFANNPNTQGNSYPAITERSGNVYIVWQHDNGNSNWFVVYRLVSDGTTSPQILTNTYCPSPGPLPAILAGTPANSFELVIVYRTSNNLTSARTTTANPIYSNWTYYTVTGTTNSSQNPSLAYRPTSFPYFGLTYDNGGGNVLFQEFNGSSWGSSTNVSSGASSGGIGSHAKSSYAVDDANHRFVAWGGVHQGQNVVVVTRDLNPTVYNEFYDYYYHPFYNPVVTGHGNLHATLLWYGDGTVGYKTTYSGSSWSTPAGFGGKNVTVSINNPAGGTAYAMNMTGSYPPYSLVMSGGALSKATDSWVYSRRVNLSNNNTGNAITLEMSNPTIVDGSGNAVSLEYASTDDSTLYTIQNIGSALTTAPMTTGESNVTLEFARSITVRPNSAGSSAMVPFVFEVVDAQTGAVLAQENVSIADGDTTFNGEDLMSLQFSNPTGHGVIFRLGSFPGNLSDIYSASFGQIFTTENPNAPKAAVKHDRFAQKKPTTFVLSNNYPNPFNPTTNLDYQLAGAGYVRMTVYNSLGQEVRKLVDGEKSAGYYSVRWDASNDASGIYFVRCFVTDNSGKTMYQDVKKLMLVK